MEDVLFTIDLKFSSDECGEVERVCVYSDGSIWDVNLPSYGFIAAIGNMSDTPITLFNVLNYLEEERGFKVIKVVHSPSSRVVYEPKTNNFEVSVEHERKEFEEWVKGHHYLKELSLEMGYGEWEDMYVDSDMEMSWSVWKAAKGIEEYLIYG